jgi:hypothetical protein
MTFGSFFRAMRRAAVVTADTGVHTGQVSGTPV